MNFPIKVIFFVLLIFSTACKNQESGVDRKILLTGETMGTYYRITYLGKKNHQEEIDALLNEMLDELSTYIPTATISKFNQNAELQLKEEEGHHFKTVFNKALEIYKSTSGAFEPTIMPLVNYWGFGYTEKKMAEADKTIVDSLRRLVGFDQILEEKVKKGIHYHKKNSNAQLDFSAIAKGYGVDILAELLESNAVTNYLIDIGGEVRANGKNEHGNLWSIGISTPKSEAALNEVQQIVLLENRSIASSGNYRNFHEKDGVKYGHTINPKSGFPEQNDLLSVSVFAKDCMTADAYATACMVLGMEKAYQLIDSNPDLEGYFIYGSKNGGLNTKYTTSLKEYLLQ